MREGRAAWSRAAEWYAAGLFLLYAVLVFAHRGAPSLTDYANWTYQGVLLREHLLHHGDVAHRLKTYPVPNSMTTVGIALFALVLPWLTAAKTWLVAQLLICFVCMRTLLRTVHAPAVAWVVVPQAVFLNVNFWYGFMNFELGVALLMLFVALLLRGARTGVLAVVLVLVFLTHMIPFCACVLFLLLWCRQEGRWWKLWSVMPAAGLLVWYVAGRFLLEGNADGQAGMLETVRDYSAGFWLFKLNSYGKSFGFANPLGMAESVYGRVGLALLLAAEVLLALLVGFAAVRAGRGAARGERFLWWGLLPLLPIFLLLPGTALGISDPGARVLQTGLALVLALCWAGAGRTVRRWASGCAVVLATGGVSLFLMYGGSVGGTVHADRTTARAVAQFARVPNDDQDYFYGALDRGNLSLPVFPTGMLLNGKTKAPR